MNRLNIVSADYASKYIHANYCNMELVKRKIPFQTFGNHIRFVSMKTNKLYHIKFARELFHKFADFYPEFADKDEEGESIEDNMINDMGDDDLIFFAQPEIIRFTFVGDLKKHGVLRRNRKTNTNTWSIGITKLDQF